MIQRHLYISGRVQGVSFRQSMLKEAFRIDPELKGFVRNLSDGRVEAVILGKLSSVMQLITWAQQGPRLAEVSQLEVLEESPDQSLSTFSVSQ